MDVLELVVPTMAYQEQVMAYKAEMLENEVEDKPGLGDSGTIQRYWITINRNVETR